MMMKKMTNKSKNKKIKIYGASDSRKNILFRENQLSRDSTLELLRCRWLQYRLIRFSFTGKTHAYLNKTN